MNQKKLILGAILIPLIILGIGTYLFFHGKNAQLPSNEVIKRLVATTPKNATYTVNGQPVTLVDGISSTTYDAGSASKTTTKYFGNEAIGDLNGDGVADVGLILTQDTGGSGTLYYAVAAIKSGQGYIGTNAILLGDRISPQITEIQDGVLIVNYANRNPGESMTTKPSMGVTKYLLMNNGSLTEAPAFTSDLYPLYSGASWGPVAAEHSADFGIVTLMQSTSFNNIINIASQSAPFTQYYHSKLIATGWTQDMSREADGPGVGLSVYTKGNQFVVISFQSVFHIQPPNEPEQCPCDVRFSLISGGT